MNTESYNNNEIKIKSEKICVIICNNTILSNSDNYCNIKKDNEELISINDDECLKNKTLQRAIYFNDSCLISNYDVNNLTKKCLNNKICPFPYESNDCPENCPYKDNQNNYCTNNCEIINFFNHECYLNNPSLKLHQNLMNNISKLILSGRADILFELFTKKGEDLIVGTENIIYQITSTKNQKEILYNDISNLYLGECEEILKEQYNIDKNLSLIIFKVDYLSNSSKIPIVFYEVYNPKTNEKLNLSYCTNKIEICYPVQINEDVLFKFNPSDGYYLDICTTYSNEYKTDVILPDRQNEFISNNYSLCEEDCKFKEYDINTKKVRCECFVKLSIPIIEEIKFNKDKLKDDFLHVKNILNIKILKCYKLVFSKNGILYNIGSYILLTTILNNIILSIIFCAKGYKNLYNKIIKLEKKEKKDTNKINKGEISIEIKKNDKKDSFRRYRKARKNKKIKNKYKSKSLLIKKNKSSPPIKKITNNLVNQSNKVKKNKSGNIKELKLNEYELNNLPYKEAIEIDKRKYCRIYLSLLKTNHPIYFTFFYNNDYNSKAIKLCLFFLSFDSTLIINALFFTDDTLHKIYLEKGEYDFIYQLPQIVYSFIISVILNAILKFLSLSEKNILEFKNENSNKKEVPDKNDLLKKLKFKFVFFFIIDYLLLLFFWYYISCFCSIYKNTQIQLIKNTLTSWALSLVYPIFLLLLPVKIRISSLQYKIKYIYKLSTFIQSLL